jgi:hypothetical protein
VIFMFEHHGAVDLVNLGAGGCGNHTEGLRLRPWGSERQSGAEVELIADPELICG